MIRATIPSEKRAGEDNWLRKRIRVEIKVLGSGCANCKRLEALVHEVIGEMNAPAQVEKVTDFKEIAAYGILATPGLVVEGVVKSAGRIPKKAEVASWVATALAEAR